jgi:hypothetical protein
MKNPATRNHREHGVALITTVIVVAVLAVVAVAMMQSATVDRLSSRSTANAHRARLAAQSGAVMAQSFLLDQLRRYPDSVTGWQNIGGGNLVGTNNEATVLYVRAQAGDTNKGARPAETNAVFLAQPLVSRVGNTPELLRTNLVPMASAVSVLPYSANDTGMVNINATNAYRAEPFVGSRSSTNPGSPITAAQWIYLTKDGLPASTNNPYTARYAFWIEDESFKVNVNTAGAGARGNTNMGTNAAGVRLEGALTNSTNAALKNIDAQAIASARGTNASYYPTIGTAALAAGITTNSASPEFRFLATEHSAGLDLSRGGFRRLPLNRGSTTNDIQSLLRIVAAITNTNASPEFGQRFYKDEADAGSVTYVNKLNSNRVTTNSQSIGSSDVGFAADLYLLRLAANLVDMLDADDRPMIVTGTNIASAQLVSQESILNSCRPSTAWAISPGGGGTAGKPFFWTNAAGNQGTNLAAIGKESIPRIQEYVIHGRVLSMSPVGVNNAKQDTNGALFTIAIDHYFEVWNPTSKDINLAGVYFKIHDMPVADLSGDALSGSQAELTDPNRSITLLVSSNSSLPASAWTLPAGGYKIITTANPTNFAQINTNMFPPLTNSSGVDTNVIWGVFANAVVVDSNTLAPISFTVGTEPWRVFTGKTYAYTTNDATNAGGTVFSNAYAVKTKYRTTGSSDYETTVVMGHTNTDMKTASGFLDSLVGLPVLNFTLDARHPDRMATNAAVPGSPNRGQNLYYLRSGSLCGNVGSGGATTSVGFGDPLGAVGDPSTLNEALEIVVYSSGSSERAGQARFLNEPNTDPAAMNASGRLVSGGSFVPHPGLPSSAYVDLSRWPDCSGSTPYYIPPSLNGGFRTIGDLGFVPDPVRLQGDSTTIDTVRGGGRTLRIGQSEFYNRTNNRSGLWDGTQTNASRNRAAWRLADIFTTNTSASDLSIKGLINPNGALRDGGAAMRAALFGLTMMGSPEGSPSPVAGRALNISNIISGINTNSPSLICRLTNTNRWIPGALNPLWERGEVSELGGSYAFSNFVANLNPQSVFDSSREEIVRRTIDMVTTRGSIFSVYVVGQALQVAQNATNVLSTVRLKQTFEIMPVLPSGAGNDRFDPADSSAIQSRFSPVTNFTTRVLRHFYD